MNRGSDRFQWPSREELRWAALAAAAVVAITCLPYLFGLLNRPPGWYYSGFIANPDEHNVYLSLMRQARDGSFFFRDMFTAEPQAGRVVNVFWFGLGLFARVSHLPLPVVYHLARVVAGWLLLMAIYCLAAHVLSTITARRAALLLAATASGLGWLFHPGPGQPNPIDFGPGLIMPEAITFLTLLLNPLFAFSMFLLVVIYAAAAHAFASGSVRAAVLAGLAALVLGNIHSYDMIPLAAVLAAYLIYLLVTKRAGGQAVLLALLIAVMAAPSLAYQLWLQHTGELSMVVKATNQPPSPEFRYVALGLGLPLLFAAAGAGTALRGNSWARLLALWLVVGFALVYAPLSFQRKLIEGLHIPVVLLAMVALERIAMVRPRVREEEPAVAARAGGVAVATRERTAAVTAPTSRRLLLAVAVLVLVSLPSDLAFLGRAAGDLASNNVRYLGNLMPPLYLSADERAALGYLDRHARPSDVLLANSFLSNYAPSLAGVRVYFGHWSETPDFVGKVREYSWFVRASTPPAAAEAFLRDHGITYVLSDDVPIASAGERIISYDGVYLPPWEGRSIPGSPQQAVTYGDVTIYRVRGR
jgi:hypothetical protein